MTLKERFLKVPMVENGLSVSEKCEQIADEFAIGFAEWKDKFIDEVADWKQDGVYLKNRFSTKELLEIYKKEKGL